jgi:hypothetical protein
LSVSTVQAPSVTNLSGTQRARPLFRPGISLSSASDRSVSGT